MKTMPIGKLMEAVAKAPATMRYEVEIDEGKLWTNDESEIVFFADSYGVTSFDHRALADAIRERCAG